MISDLLLLKCLNPLYRLESNLKFRGKQLWIHHVACRAVRPACNDKPVISLSSVSRDASRRFIGGIPGPALHFPGDTANPSVTRVRASG